MTTIRTISLLALCSHGRLIGVLFIVKSVLGWFIALLFGPAQRPLAVIKVKNGFGGCLRAPRTPSIYATEPMEWVGGRTADLPEIFEMEGQNGWPCLLFKPLVSDALWFDVALT